MSDLLPGFDPIPEPEPKPKLTPGARAAERIAAGIHPATKLRLIPGDRTCGDCARLWWKAHPNGGWWKCAAMNLSNDGPDMTKRWPACSLFKQKEIG